jgi:hypothetical protein
MNERNAPPRILVAGIPASGKTSYSAWLEREQGFLHLDLDELEKGNGTEKNLDLRDCLRHSAERFLRVVSEVPQPIVLDWGFPPTLLTLADCLNQNGFAIWWFDGDRQVARESFIRRATVPIDAFDIQMKSIEEYWQRIQNVFDENLIYTVSDGPNYATPEYIYSRMFSKRRPRTHG